MSVRTCTGCGTPVPAHVQFCVNCGVRADGAASDPGSVQAAPIPPASPTGAVEAPAAVATFQQPAPTQPSPVRTYEVPAVPPRRNETRRLVLIGVSALLVTLIIRIVFAATSAEPEGELVAELPVGAEGGSTEFEDGGKLTVPKGALKQRETITVRRRLQREPIRGVSPGGGAPLVIPANTVFVYFLGPVDIVLLRPITLTLPALAGPGQGLVFVSANGQVTFLEGTQRGRSITIQLASFNFGRGRGAFVNVRD